MVIHQLKNNYIIFILCLFIYILKFKIPGQPSEPYGIYNIDSACRFLIYYAIGFLSFPAIHKLFSLHTKKSKTIITISGTISFIYSVLLFEKIDLLKGITTIPIINIFHQIFTALLVIWLYFVIAYLFENVPFFQGLGQATLYLCGNEYIVKTLVSYFIGIVGLSINITNPLSAYLYTLTLLIIPSKKRCYTNCKHYHLEISYYCRSFKGPSMIKEFTIEGPSIPAHIHTLYKQK